MLFVFLSLSCRLCVVWVHAVTEPMPARLIGDETLRLAAECTGAAPKWSLAALLQKWRLREGGRQREGEREGEMQSERKKPLCRVREEVHMKESKWEGRVRKMSCERGVWVLTLRVVIGGNPQTRLSVPQSPGRASSSSSLTTVPTPKPPNDHPNPLMTSSGVRSGHRGCLTQRHLQMSLLSRAHGIIWVKIYNKNVKIMPNIMYMGAIRDTRILLQRN